MKGRNIHGHIKRKPAAKNLLPAKLRTSEQPAYFTDIPQTVLLRICIESVDNIQRNVRLHKRRRSHLHHRSARHEEFDGVLPAGNPPQTHNGDGHRVRNLVHHAQGDRLDGRAGKARGFRRRRPWRGMCLQAKYLRRPLPHTYAQERRCLPHSATI